MRRAGRLDANQREIVEALRAAGASVRSLASVGNGCPDLLVGYGRVNTLLEVKDGRKEPARRRLKPLEQGFVDTWRGQVSVVESVDQALAIVTARAVVTGAGRLA